MLIKGSCHCGHIAVELHWPGQPGELPARACSCSFCRKHGGVWTAHPGARLRVRIARPAQVSRYAFGTATADFHVCTDCGVVPVATSEIAGRLYAVVNVHSFDDVPAAMLAPAPSNFDGEDAEARLARRQRNWIGEVVIAVADAPPATIG
jgi:hypothetical protein